MADSHPHLRWLATRPAERPSGPLEPQALVEYVADIVDERRPKPDGAVLARAVPAEHEQLLRARDRRIEEMALVGELVAMIRQVQTGQLGELRAVLTA